MRAVARVKAEEQAGVISINPPDFRTIEFTIEGDAPYVQLRFSQKQKSKIREDHAISGKDEGTQKKARKPKDYEALYHEAMYEADGGQRGLNALSIKRALVAACRLTKFPMSMAKLCIFIEEDGRDWVEPEIPLIYFTKGEPQMLETICRNANHMPDLRVRAMWEKGWQAKPRVRYDADRLSKESVIALMTRAGMQVGVGEGRPSSSTSDGAGMGWGTFKIISAEERTA
jgi:hypothetical protein